MYVLVIKQVVNKLLLNLIHSTPMFMNVIIYIITFLQILNQCF